MKSLATMALEIPVLIINIKTGGEERRERRGERRRERERESVPIGAIILLSKEAVVKKRKSCGGKVLVLNWIEVTDPTKPGGTKISLVGDLQINLREERRQREGEL